MLDTVEDCLRERNAYASDLMIGVSKEYHVIYEKIFKFALSSGLPVPIITRGLTISLSRALLFLDQNKHRLVWSDHKMLLNTVQNRIIRRRALKHLTLEKDVLFSFARALLLSFLSNSGNAAGLCHMMSVSGPPLNCTVLPDQLVMDIPIPAWTREPHKRDRLIVALFNCSLEYPINTEADVEVELQNNTSHASSMEVHYLEQLHQLFLSNCVTLVVCQKRVHPHLKRLLSKSQILCIPRVSIRFMSALLSISGGRQLGGLPNFTSDTHRPLDASCLGRVKSVRCEYLYGKPYLVVTGCGVDASLPARRSFSTLVISSPTEELTAEMKETASEVLHHLSCLVENPFVLPGGGLWQRDLADHLLKYVSEERIAQEDGQVYSRISVKGRILSVIEKFAQVLVECTESKSEDMGVDSGVESCQECVHGLKTVVNTLATILNIDEEIVLGNDS